MTTKNSSFARRHAVASRPVVEDDFPDSSVVGLIYVLDSFVEDRAINDWTTICKEALRTTRRYRDTLPGKELETKDLVLSILKAYDWFMVFTFCERIYSVVLKPVGHKEQVGFDQEWVEDEDISSVRRRFQDEINTLMDEDGFSYEMVDGVFVRPGLHHTRKSLERANKVLGNPVLRESLIHYNKARRFFRSLKDRDYENSVKEAVQALEACAKSLFPDVKAKDLNEFSSRMRGTGEHSIPPAIAEGIKKLYAFRGSASGVAHGGANGGIVTAEVAELVLSLSASYITYLAAMDAARSMEADV